MYDKQSRKERGYGSDADSDGVVGFGKPRAAKSIMTEEQVQSSACFHVWVHVLKINFLSCL